MALAFQELADRLARALAQGVSDGPRQGSPPVPLPLAVKPRPVTALSVPDPPPRLRESPAPIAPAPAVRPLTMPPSPAVPAARPLPPPPAEAATIPLPRSLPAVTMTEPSVARQTILPPTVPDPLPPVRNPLDPSPASVPPPAPRTTQEGGALAPAFAPAPRPTGDSTRVVQLLERVVRILEGMVSQGGGPGRSAGGFSGAGDRQSAVAGGVSVFDIDAAENYPAASPSVNVSTVAGTGGASSVRGQGSRRPPPESVIAGGSGRSRSPQAQAGYFEPGRRGF